MIPISTLLLSAISFLIATYFTAVAYRWIDPEALGHVRLGNDRVLVECSIEHAFGA